MQIYPEKYDGLELASEERSFIRTLDRAIGDESMAYYVLKINPRKKSDDSGKTELFNMLLLSAGILLFQFQNPENDLGAKLLINVGPMVINMLLCDLKEKLKGSRYLIDDNGELLYDLSVCYVMPNVEGASIKESLGKEALEFCSKHVLFKEDIKKIRSNGISELLGSLNSKIELTEDKINNIFQRFCPEITIPRKCLLDDSQSVEIEEADLEAVDRAVLSYRLDTWQIDIVNKIKRGNQLILACAGSGKSVLLISKCFKLASLNPCEKFLITCYNRNLYNYYEWAIAQAGFTDRNVQCMTINGLYKYLLETNNISLPVHYHNQDNVYYDHLFIKVNNALQSGLISQRFYGIFIDEVQIFKPEWYRLCFSLLKSKEETEHYFVIAGDKSQDIKNNIKHGKAPWQGGGKGFPEYRGKTLPIERNYRNSKPINDAIDSYVNHAKDLAGKLGVDLSSDPELFLRGTAYREGREPRIIELKDMSNLGEANAICDEIKYYISLGYSEVDIAVIVYNRKGKKQKGWKDSYYNLLPDIRSIFNRQGWEDPAVLIFGESEGATYGARRGVTISTIEGSLGLDFRVVILAGLRPLGVHEGVVKQDDLQKMSAADLETKKEAVKKNINFLYTGCTRAKDELSIILSAPPGESMYMDLLRESM